MKKHIPKIIALALILFLGVIFQKNYVTDFPNFRHAWAQSDRYALALGFVENDLNFFKPETKVLNHQFPNWWLDHSKSSVTAVDFPIHDYIPAVIMKMTGSNSPMIFRLYILFYSFLGLFFLFKIAQRFTKDDFKSLFIVLFAATSPVFIYYQNGFLPTIPSLANAIIGIYFYSGYLETSKNRSFAWALLFLTLAALSRTTFVIPLIAVIGIECLRSILYKVQFYKKIIAIVVSFSIILLYHMYNNVLRSEYGSLFLNQLMTPKSLNETIDMIKLIADNWLYHYFSKIHYFVVLLFILIAGYFFAIKKIKLVNIQRPFAALIVVYFIGCILFAFAMLLQFPAHDYYFLDTFYLPCVLAVILIIAYIPVPVSKIATVLKVAFLLFLSYPLVQNGRQSQWDSRITGDWDRTTAMIHNYQNADKFLDELHISKDAEILALDVSAPNIPFILMHHKGYAQLKNRYHILKKMMDWQPDYVVFENEYFIANSYSIYPGIINRMTKIADNGKISVCRVNKTPNSVSLADFLGIQNKKPIVEETVDFEKTNYVHWSNIQRTQKPIFEGKYSHHLVSNKEFGITYKTNDFVSITQSPTILNLEAEMNYTDLNHFEMVVAISENGNTSYYKSINLASQLKKKDTWQKVNLVYYLPKVNSQNYEFAVYIMNPERSELFVDNLKFKVYN